ncbi:hypothetical protein [Nonlabens sp. Asnod2-A12]|uniref:hypothetical protein n=1 Tax=Nonlabens sp. Asnod2-A12 TaxID=3160578 RepID=UPI00386F0924
MNYLIKPFSIICALIILSSCEEDEVVEKCQFTDPTYQFTTEQEQKRISFEYFEGQIIKYRSNDNEVLNFEVYEVRNCPRGSYESGFFGTSLKHTYDSQIIRLQIIENDTAKYSYKTKVQYFLTSQGNRFRNAFNFPLWNVRNAGYANPEEQDPANIFITNNDEINSIGTMNILNHTFNKVIKIESNSTDVVSSREFGLLDQNVNILYYDQDFGIIRFDEVDGTIWQVKYPE